MGTSAERQLDLLQLADNLAPELEAVVDDLKRVAATTVADLKEESTASVTSSGERARVSSDFVRRLQGAAMAVANAVKAQNDLHRTAASRARQLTPEQRRVAMVKMIADMSYRDRRDLVTALLTEHNRVARDKDRPVGAPQASFVDIL